MVTTWKTKKRKTSKFVNAEVTTGMREKGIINLERVDREEWRKENKTLGT